MGKSPFSMGKSPFSETFSDLHPPIKDPSGRTVALVAQLGVGAGAEQGGGAEAEALPEKTVEVLVQLPSGERTKSNGKSPFFMGKSTINDINCHFPLIC